MRAIIAVVFSLAALSCGSGPTPATSPVPTAPGQPLVTYAIAGTVRDTAGTVLEAADVWGGVPTSKSGTLLSTQTDSQGRYAGRLPAGSFAISVRKPGFDTATENIAVSADMVVDITLRPGVSVSGVVTEAGVGPLADATVEIISGPNAGMKTRTGPVPGAYLFQHVTPGDLTLRASKPGYVAVERALHATIDAANVDFTLKWNYGDCLLGVAPVLFDFYSPAGGTESVSVAAAAGRTWMVSTDSAWIEPVSQSTQTGSGRAVFRVRPSPPGANDSRTGAVMIRCSPSQGQNVWIAQLPDCQIMLTPSGDTPDAFGPAGGQGYVFVHTGVPACHWEARPQADWLRTVGVKDHRGDLQLSFIVAANDSGAARTGAILINDVRWVVQQR